MTATMIDATRLNLIDKIEKTGASVGMWRDVHCAPLAWAAHFQAPAVSDDAKPMTGVWYRHREHSWMQGKVTHLGDDWCEVASTDGIATCTFAEFARTWELI